MTDWDQAVRQMGKLQVGKSVQIGADKTKVTKVREADKAANQAAMFKIAGHSPMGPFSLIRLLQFQEDQAVPQPTKEPKEGGFKKKR